ncbi:MAG TPA: tetratricopeptide repeat protein, partial [Thermoanaerobaculia bacterium]|nr:tetratricopeptide repeat protein [Thermoanaerobaculia bacterium]
EPLPEETLPPLEAEEPLFDLDGALSEEPADLSFEEEAAPETAPAIEEIGEIDFYLEQDLLQEAELKLDSLLVIFPTDPDLLQRQATLTQRLRAKATPPPPAAPAAPAVPPPMAFSAADIENELMSAIPDDDDDIEVMARPVAAALSRAAAPKIDEGNLFADEDDFFDLAAELEDELAEEADDSISLSEEEQSLEEIFREFKKGVESQLDSEDYDTHYNLGIAYKEMGLIDEAIGEFQLAAKDPKRAIECCSMLGLCFLEKGMPQLAIKWYRKGLDVDDISEDEHLGMLYDLGSAYMEVGDIENAHKAFIEVYGLNTNYRDIVTKMKSLEDVKS